MERDEYCVAITGAAGGSRFTGGTSVKGRANQQTDYWMTLRKPPTSGYDSHAFELNEGLHNLEIDPGSQISCAAKFLT